MSRKPILTKLILGGALLLAATSAAGEAPLLSLTEAPAWRHSRAFIDAYNAGDGAQLPSYFTEWLSRQAAVHQSAASRAAATQRLRNELGELEVIEASGVSHVMVLNARTRQGAPVEVVLVVNADDPSRVDEIRLVRADEALGEEDAP